MSDYEDVSLTCVDCNQKFTWTVGEQKFFADRKLLQPKRCAGCRLKRRGVGNVEVMSGDLPSGDKDEVKS